MPSFKSDSSFFHKIAMGAVGSQAVKRDMTEQGHAIVELERGSLDAKIWKDPKRKRVRIPDLVCTCCGQRVEVRAKSEPKISMSHSPTIPERRWDYGMVSNDWIAIPICRKQLPDDDRADHWTRGMLVHETSYWHEKEWVRWQPQGTVNYFTVDAFRAVTPDQTERKGVEEGAETTLTWRACFAPITGRVQNISGAFITIAANDGKRKRAGWQDMALHVRRGDSVIANQVIACKAVPIPTEDRTCRGGLTAQNIAALLRAPQLPVRFAGVKLARIKRLQTLAGEIRAIADSPDEDIYVRLEAKAYLCGVLGDDVARAFGPALSALDKPDQLEAIIAIGEIGNESAATVLAEVLGDSRKDYFLRAAAAYCLGRLGEFPVARRALVNAFSTQSHQVREDALIALADAGFGALTELFAGLVQREAADIQAGCAEAIRWLARRSNPADVAARIAPELANAVSNENRTALAVWLSGQLSPEIMRPALGAILDTDARLAYTLTVAWAFAQSWIAPLHDGFTPPSRA
ncbi:MAG: HEAT repeat domain-containing protein [Opitutae bacterium]|nr:HEAT repeat domain-containing protein [Opitutae bacterium]